MVGLHRFRVCLDFSNEESRSNRSISGAISSTPASGSLDRLFLSRLSAWTLGAGYAVLPGHPVALESSAVLRYFGLEASTDWQLGLTVTGPGGGQTSPRTGSISRGRIFGMGSSASRGGLVGKSNWSIPYYLDVGTGSSSLTWQGMLGIAYSYKWFCGATLALLRHLYYDMKDDNRSRTCASAARRSG